MLLLAMLAAAVIGGGISGGVQNVSAAEADRTMTFGIQEYGIGVDPAQETNTAWNCSRYGIGECLFKFNDSMEVVNTLCDDYTVNEEHTEWVFHIREGVKFSDGCDLTPETVKASFERLLEDGKNGSSTPEKFLPAESVITADNAAGTVTIVTPDPVVDLTKNLAYPTMIILDTEHTTDYVSGSIGTGPYAMSEFKEHVGAMVVRNEYYWDGEVPYDSIELLYMGDASAKAMAMQAGQLDLTENVTNPLYFLYVFLEVLSASIRGAGKSIPPMIIILINSCLVRVAALQIIMNIQPTVTGAAVVYPLTWAANVICLALYYCFGRWKSKSLM